MPLPTRAIGFMSKLQIGKAEGNGGLIGDAFVNFGVKSSTIKVSSDEFEVGDTESGPYKRYQPGRYMFQGTFNAFIDTAVQTFNSAQPAFPNINIGAVIWLKFYPTGIAKANAFVPVPAAAGATVNLPGGGGNDFYNCPNFVIFNINMTQDVGQPVTIEFDGKCDNAFRVPQTTG